MRKIVFFAILMLSVLNIFGQNHTWSEDIACIVYTNCASCHNVNGIAPFSLMSYEEAAPMASLMATAVTNRDMPPWPPDPNKNRFLDERVLSQEEIDAIRSWAEAGAPSGDLSSAPAPPVLESIEVIQQPDLVIQLPEYISQAVTEDDFRCFVIPSEIYEDRFIEAIEVVAGNAKIVHHAGIFVEDTNIPKLLDDSDPAPGYSCFGGIGTNNFKFVGGWVPGMPPIQFPAGMGMTLPANSNIVVQLHYPAGSQGQSDQTKVNFKLSDQSDLREIFIESFLNHGSIPDFNIPANTVRSFETEFFMPINITVLGVGPHMHLVGQSINSYAVSDGGFDTLSLVNVPKWDFDWQGFYEFKKPKIIQSRSTLRVEATYDNTENNPHNPNSPPRDVAAGQTSTDEMMIVSLLFTRYAPGDEDLVFFDDPPPGSPDCNQTIVSVEESDPEASLITIFPSPVPQSSRISVQLSAGVNRSKKMNFEISDLQGKRIHYGTLSNTKIQYLDLPEHLKRGVYIIAVNTENKRIRREKIIVL